MEPVSAGAVPFWTDEAGHRWVALDEAERLVREIATYREGLDRVTAERHCQHFPSPGCAKAMCHHALMAKEEVEGDR